VASLFVIRGRDQGRRYELEDAVTRIGRDGGNPIQLHDTEVSRQHAELRREGHHIHLIDLDSSNGCYVNSERVERTQLASGDRVQLGRTLMVFTGNEHQSSEDLSDVVEIAARGPGSRIVKSLGQEAGSAAFQGEAESPSPWLARARSNLQVMYRTALAVSHTLEIDDLLGRVLKLIFEWIEADRGCIMLRDPETEELQPKARSQRPGVETDDDKMSISRTILDYVMQRKEGVMTSDAQEDERWNPEGSILKLGVREAICVPMQGRYGIVGVIYVDTFTPPGRIVQSKHRNRFTEEQLKLMIAIGHQAALAVEDTYYYSAMVQAERLAAVGQAIAQLSHHIKNILQGIRGGSYLIEEGLIGPDLDVVRKGWTIVEKNQEKISQLVMDMLTFSKEREPEPTAANLNDMTRDAVELMQLRAEEMDVDLAADYDPDMPELMFDVDAMGRATLNVITNAIDACEGRDCPRVRVTTRYRAEEGLAEINVIDNGAGIAAEDLGAVFTMFESRKGTRGTGLGLPVSQKILREHGGDIEVESEVDVGSRFTLVLPATFPPEEDQEQNDETQSGIRKA